MKRTFFCFIFLFFSFNLLFSLTPTDFDRIIDFSITLKELDQSLTSGRTSAVPKDKYVILHGTYANFSILNADEANYKVRIEMIIGEWFDIDEVKSYRSIVQFTGPEFSRYFPQKKRRGQTDSIDLNSRIIVVAKAIEPIKAIDGKTVWLLEGLYVREIK